MSNKNSIYFALNQTHIAFESKWGEYLDKKPMLDYWSEWLEKDIKAEHINKATKYCLENLDHRPNFPEFRNYCNQAKNNEAFKPPVSWAEKQAFAFLKFIIEREQGPSRTNSSITNYSDPFLISALVLGYIGNKQAGLLKAGETYWIEEQKGRLNMFANEFEKWQKEAEKDGDFWLAKVFKLLDK